MKNRWVIPDIHGHIKTLKSLIEDRIALSKSDVIYFLGDYIDRGPDSKSVIDFIMSLQDSGFDVNCISIRLPTLPEPPRWLPGWEFLLKLLPEV